MNSGTELKSRETLRSAKRVLIKAGTSIVTNPNGQPSLTRLGAIVEQIAELHNDGKEVLLVSSGAVGMGKNLLRKQGRLHLSVNQLHGSRGDFGSDMNLDKHLADSFVDEDEEFKMRMNLTYEADLTSGQRSHDSACAAAGQFELMNFYSTLFAQCNMSASQILVTQSDFKDEFRLKNLRYAVDRLLALGTIPIINENDAVSANIGYASLDVFSEYPLLRYCSHFLATA